MFLSKLGVFAHLALAASAILIPPTISIDDFGDDHALETLAINPLKRSVAIECPGCPLATTEGDKLLWTPDVGNAFSLEFEVGPLEDTLAIDGVQLYPPSFNYFANSFYATQINPSSESNLRLRVTGYQFHYSSAETVSEAGIELLPMAFQITSVEGVHINPPALTINVLKDTEGRLMIASFQVQQVDETTTNDDKKDCNEWPLFCKWKSILGDKMGKHKKAGKGCNKGSHGPPPMEEDDTLDQPPYRPHGKPPHHRPHHGDHHHGGHRHHHHGHHRVFMFLRRAFFTVLVPVLIGIFAGTLTYLIGMALGCLIAIIIAKFRGQSYKRIVTEDEADDDVVESEAGGEKEEYAELPTYEAPPNYEEGVGKEEDESK